MPTEKSDGGRRYISLRKAAMQQKAEYISGLKIDKAYLKVFDDAEEALEYIGVVSACERDIDLARKLDVDFIKNQRRTNATILREELHDMLAFDKMEEIDTPMFVPILVSDGKRDALRRYLINNGIYCPVHWPLSEYHKLDEKEISIYKNELSLVCDQRYTEEDMYRMVDAIKQFWKEA